jgi:membrane-associated protein
MHEHLLHFLGWIGPWSYLVIFICVTLECAAVFFLPAETLVVIGGFFAAHGQLDLAKFIVVVLTGSVLGFSLGFKLGRRFGRAKIVAYGRWIGLEEKHFQRVDAFFARYGAAAVVLGRFTSVMRAFVSLAAGFSTMSFRRFFFFNVVGGVLWSVGFALLGYFVGENWSTVERLMGRTSLIVIFLLVMIGALFWLRREK